MPETIGLSAPRFPLDLELVIFQTTALIYRETMPKLLLVARRVLHWIEPMLYETVQIALNEPGRSGRAVLLTLDKKPPGFFSKAVKNLMLAPTSRFSSSYCDLWSDAELKKVLRAAGAVVNMCLISWPGEVTHALLPMVAHMRPRRLTLLAHKISDPILDLDHAFFSDVTHFCLSVVTENAHDEEALWTLTRDMTRLRSLSHIAVTGNTPPSILKELLLNCPNLCALIRDGDGHTPELAEICDPRMVVNDFHGGQGPSTTYAVWMHGVEHGDDVWARADRFIARKRRGEIEDSCMRLPGSLEEDNKIPWEDRRVMVEGRVPVFTPRLEGMIFKRTAVLYPEAITQLMLVAHRVRSWVEPYLFTHIKIVVDNLTSPANLALERVAYFVATVVRSIELRANKSRGGVEGDGAWSTDSEWIEAFLLWCSNVVGLTLDIDLSDEILIAPLSHMHPTHVAIAVDPVAPTSSMTDANARMDFLAGVTHLHLFESASSDSKCNNFDDDETEQATSEDPFVIFVSRLTDRLPVLKYLAIPCRRPNTGTIVSVLSNLPYLHALVLLAEAALTSFELEDSTLTDADPRVIIVPLRLGLDSCAVGAKAGGELWRHVEDFMERKRKGKNDGSDYLLSFEG